MWTLQIKDLAPSQTHLSVSDATGPLTYSEVLKLWANSVGFRSFWLESLIRPEWATWAAYRWETPPVTTLTANRDFECVLLRSDALDRTLDRQSFRTHFTTAKPVVVFENLGRDATLIVPCPSEQLDCYGHLARFMRDAPEPRKHALWQTVATTMQKKIGAEPIWLSTAGGGVSWLHVRLDQRPKYYGYRPFARVP